VNTPVSTRAKCFTKICFPRTTTVTLAMICMLFVASPHADAQWSVDFSRRAKAVRDVDLLTPGRGQSRVPASYGSGDEVADGSDTASVDKGQKGMFDALFEGGEPVQEIVIMNTEKGFVPATVRVRKNGRYRIHVVNVNDKEKNVSFILDGFSEHHATFFGKIKTFHLEPMKEGTFSFQSPETSAEGKLVVFNPQISIRGAASE
jgi:hypothetical protein